MLDAGIDLSENASFAYNNTLRLAVINERFGSVKFLVRNGYSLDLMDGNSLTPYFCSAIMGNQLDIVRFLIQKMGEMSQEEQNYAFKCAVISRWNQLEKVQLLLSLGLHI